MHIITLNINGIRAALKKGFGQWLQMATPDVLCLQEVKALQSQIEILFFEQMGYKVLWHAAQQSGYAGTAILSKLPIIACQTGFSDGSDADGRFLVAELESCFIVNIYAPAGGSMRASLVEKGNFYQKLYAELKLLQNAKKPFVLAGDFNIALTYIDVPQMPNIESCIGFLPIERSWLKAVLSLGFVDAFRLHNPMPYQYTWLGYGAQSRGWRIDYIWVSQVLAPEVLRANILKNAVFSDHRPVQIVLDSSTI